MKRINKLLIIFSLLLAPAIGQAQGNASIAKGNVLINPSITLGWYNYGYGYDRVNLLPPVALNFEYAAHELFSLGVEAEYSSRNYRQTNFFTGGYTYRYQYKGLSLRGSFHYLDLLKNIFEDDLDVLNSEQFDFYVGFTAGVLVTEYTEKWTSSVDGVEHEKRGFDSSSQFGYFAGFRYYFNSSLGAFLETGKNNLGWAKLGLTLKF